MANFIPRTTPPRKGDKYYTHYTKGGINICMMINQDGDVLANCVGYAHGRLLELWGRKSCFWYIAGNPNTWLDSAKKGGLKTGNTPKLGAAIVWPGHVAVVEGIDKNGNITISQSHYKGVYFDTQVLKKPYTFNGQSLMGFVYCPVEFEEQTTEDIKEETVKPSVFVQTGAYLDYASAKKKAEKIKALGFKTVTVNYEPTWYRVFIHCKDKTEANNVGKKLTSNGISWFITTLKGKEI